MHRCIARSLLLLTLVGIFGPLVLAASTAPVHACCVRKAVHHCQDSQVSAIGQLEVRGTNCCGHGWGRSVVTSRWARSQPRPPIVAAQSADNCSARLRLARPTPEFSGRQSTRAPPHFSL